MALFLNLSHYSAFAASVMTALVICGFVRLVVSRNDAIGYIAKGLSLLHLAVRLRTAYWGIPQHFVSRQVWNWWNETSGGTSVNLLFNTMIVFGGYFSLKALQMSTKAAVR